MERELSKDSDRIIAVVDLGIFKTLAENSRFEKFCLRRICRYTVLEHIVHRLRECEQLDGLVIVGNNLPGEVLTCCHGPAEIKCLAEEHWLARLATVAEATNASWIYRVGANCPFVDPVLIDRLSSIARKLQGFDFVCYSGKEVDLLHMDHLGLAGELIHHDCLKRLTQAVNKLPDNAGADTPSIARLLRSIDGVFQSRIVPLCSELDRSDLRFIIENETDLDIATTICEGIGMDRTDWQSLLSIVERHLDIRELMKKQNVNSGRCAKHSSDQR